MGVPAMKLKQLQKLLAEMLRDEPAILADWLEDHTVPGTDQDFLREVQESLREDQVWVVKDAVDNTGTSTERVCSWGEINKKSLMHRGIYHVSPVLHLSQNKLYMTGTNYSSWYRWTFQPMKRHANPPLWNPLLFSLVCLRYGWRNHSLANRALACIQA